MPTEIVTAEPVENYNTDRHFSVKVLKPFLAGSKWREKGEVVKLPAPSVVARTQVTLGEECSCLSTITSGLR